MPVHQGFCRVAIDSAVLALDRPFDYAIPERMRGKLRTGSVVRVPLHGRRVRAFVVEMLDAPSVPSARPLSAIVGADPLFGPHEISLARWIADRYVTSLGSVLHDAVPGRYSLPPPSDAGTTVRAPAPAWLRAAPAAAVVTYVVPSVRDEPALFAHLAGETASSGRDVLIVCPRVAVAQGIAAAVKGSALLHGDHRPGERASVWNGARTGRVHVVVGGRASLLVPLERLGLVAVASAHDRALRSERSPRLHAAVVARRRALQSEATFVASSPSPPLELAAGDGDLVAIEPAQRAPVRAEVVRPRGGPVTARLLEAVRWAIDRGQDALVFTGRIGGVLRLRCVDCGWYPRCPRCEAGLGAEPDDGGVLRCRVCDGSAPVPDECASCGGALSGRGWGHTRVASALERADVRAPVVRFVRGDVVTVPDGPAVVVGTAAAAHGWPRLFAAVCVADLDQLLARPDFRAGEHALQTLHELAGCMRGDGRFLVQTREPEHHVVQAFTRRSFRYFADRELPLRREAGYPPYGEIVVVESSASALEDLSGSLRSAGARVIGPVAGRQGADRILVRIASVTEILGPLRRFALDHPKSKIDVDPTNVI